MDRSAEIDDVHLVTVGGRTLVVDGPVAARLRVGDSVHKRAWSRTLRTPREAVRLSLSSDVWGMAVAMPALVATSWFLIWLPPGRPSRRRSAPGTT